MFDIGTWVYVLSKITVVFNIKGEKISEANAFEQVLSKFCSILIYQDLWLMVVKCEV